MSGEGGKMAEEEGRIVEATFPSGRIKRMMKLDKEINKINSEALFVVCCSLDLFIESLAKRCGEVAIEKKRKTVNLEHLRIAVKRHQPTSDFLLDSLPIPSATKSPPPPTHPQPRNNTVLPPTTRRIDHFFHKAS